jgi:hypothetical protein
MANIRMHFSDSLGGNPKEDNSPEAVAKRDALNKYLEGSRQRQALERAKADPVIATKIAVLEHRRQLAKVRLESIAEIAIQQSRTFTVAEGRAFDQAVEEQEQIDRELKDLIRG